MNLDRLEILVKKLWYKDVAQDNAGRKQQPEMLVRNSMSKIAVQNNGKSRFPRKSTFFLGSPKKSHRETLAKLPMRSGYGKRNVMEVSSNSLCR